MPFSTTYALPCGTQQVLDIDADAAGDFLAVLDNADVLTSEGRLSLPHPFQFPLIRRVDADRFLVVDARRGQAPNGHLFDRAGRRLISFDAGDGVEDVLVLAERIVVSYFDEGVLSGKRPAADGLAVFDFTGQQCFGYNAEHAPYLLDCYALCPLGPDRVLVYPYPEAPLLELRLSDFQVRRSPVPAKLSGVSAISAYRGEPVYFVCPDGQASYFGWWKDNRVRRHFVTETNARYRGLPQGQFLTHDATSFTVFDAAAALQLEV
jgi:hypothetical protein